jgi:hypothetical protein
MKQLTRFLCSADLASRYNSCKWPTWCTIPFSICTLVQALRLCTGHTAYKGSRGIALPFHDHGTRTEWGVSVTLRPLSTPGKDPVPIVQEAGCATGPVWPGAENFVLIGIRSPDLPSCSQSLYRLPYPAHLFFYVCFNSLHVSSNLVLIIRRINCINTTYGMCHFV